MFGAGLERKKAPLLSVMLLSVSLLMLLGWVGSELLLSPLLIRAQLFRTSAYLLLGALMVLTCGVDKLWRSGNVFAVLGGALLLLVFSLPALLGFRAALLLLGAWGLWVARKLPPPAAVGLAAILLLTTLSDLSLHTRFWNVSPPPLSALLPRPVREGSDDAWSDIQRLTREHSPSDTLVLTPPHSTAPIIWCSIIPFSAKWVVIEPEEGQRNLEPVDQHLAWCRENDIEVEFHFVSGYEPPWLKEKTEEEQQAHLLRHASDLIDRYADQIQIWQIVNERRLQNISPAVFKLFRERHPQALLGVSHCARFYSEREGRPREQDLWRGWDSVTQLQRAGATADYFGVHAHRPFGSWWDPRTIYEVLDEYQERGVRVRVTETGVSRRGKIEASVHTGEWTDALQAEYLVQVYKVLFSHQKRKELLEVDSSLCVKGVTPIRGCALPF